MGVDVWGLGIIFLELLSGCRLSDLIFGSAEPALREDFPNEQTLIRVSSPLMKRLIVKMLIKDRSKRIKINEVIDILAENNLK